MLRHMRTSLDLPDPLFKRAQKLARARGVPFRALVAEALQNLLMAQGPAKQFRLTDTTFGGDGLVEGLDDLQWERISSLVHDEGAKGG